MADGKRCPACSHDIGMWAVLSAAWPTRVWCPHCGARLRYQGTANVSRVIILATLMIGVVSCGLGLLTAFIGVHIFWCVAVAVLTFALLYAPIEWFGSRFLRENRTLECVRRPSPESSDYREAPPSDDRSLPH